MNDGNQQVSIAMGITCAMGRIGRCEQDAVTEGLFWPLKHEWPENVVLRELEHGCTHVFKYIATCDTVQRVHKILICISRDQFEAEHTPILAV
jgi:hypothetical protein